VDKEKRRSLRSGPLSLTAALMTEPQTKQCDVSASVDTLGFWLFLLLKGTDSLRKQLYFDF
jgi:hypothetical protein